MEGHERRLHGMRQYALHAGPALADRIPVPPNRRTAVLFAEHTGPMQVVSGPIGRERVHFEAPAARRLNREMNAFVDRFNKDADIDAVLKAALSHLWFVTIHPF